MNEHDDELHLNNEIHGQGEIHEHNDIHGHDGDRLPWLEAVEPDADHEAHNRRRATGVLGAGLLALGAVIGGLWWMNSQTPPVKGADSKLIAAGEGDYKAKPADAGGMKVEGTGDRSAATAQGVDSDAKIDASGKPEAPIAAAGNVKPAVEAAPVKPNSTAKIADVRDVTPKAKPAPAPSGAAAAAPGTGLIQLGAYGSETSAEQGWTKLKDKYAVLASLSHSVVSASVAGSTVFRLRAAAGGAAAETCAKLKSAGAGCIIAH